MNDYAQWQSAPTRWKDNDVYGDEGLVADEHFVHVFVDRETRRPVPLGGKPRDWSGQVGSRSAVRAPG